MYLFAKTLILFKDISLGWQSWNPSLSLILNHFLFKMQKYINDRN